MVASASLAEGAPEGDRFVESRLAAKTPMTFLERFVMAKNVRNYVYGLEDARRLSVRKVALRVYCREEVRALQQYVLSHDVDTQEDYTTRHSTRPLAGKATGYLKIVVAAAEVAGDERDNALLALAKDTRFWPGVEDVADDDRKAANEFVELLAHLPAHLDATCPLESYFDVIERQEILPRRQGGGMVFDGVDEFGWWDHEAIPSVRLASRWLQPDRSPVIVAVSDVPATGQWTKIDFDALHAAGRSFEDWVNRRQVFSIGVGRLSGVIGPVAIVSHEILLANGGNYKIKGQGSASAQDGTVARSIRATGR